MTQMLHANLATSCTCLSVPADAVRCHVVAAGMPPARDKLTHAAVSPCYVHLPPDVRTFATLVGEIFKGIVQ